MTAPRCVRCGATFADARLAAGPCPACLLADDELGAPEIVAGAYRIDGLLGRGGMGVVFAAHDLRLGRDVALKFLPAASADDAARRARFDREAQTLARLDHPGLVRIYDVGEDAGRPYFVSERVRPPARFADVGAADLAALLRRRGPAAFSSFEAAALVADAADALAAAHRAGVVHRDVKPANLLVGVDGAVKVADFGVAALVRGDGADARLTATGVAPGTPGYMAPETLAGAAPDPRQDVYALGATFFELLTGRPPVGACGPAPAPFAEVIARALAPHPAARWSTAGDFAAAIRAAARGGSATAASASSAADGGVEDLASWTRAAALVLTGATAVVIFAVKSSLTPKTLPPGADDPLVLIVSERFADGSVRTAARFETWPMLGAVAALAAATAAYGVLRRHWRRGDLLHPTPDRPLPGVRSVLIAGGVSFALWLVLQLFRAAGWSAASAYVPVFGGLVLLWLVYETWFALLEAHRTSRPLRREPVFWIGVAAGLTPPLIEFARAVGGN